MTLIFETGLCCSGNPIVGHIVEIMNVLYYKDEKNFFFKLIDAVQSENLNIQQIVLHYFVQLT